VVDARKTLHNCISHPDNDSEVCRGWRDAARVGHLPDPKAAPSRAEREAFADRVLDRMAKDRGITRAELDRELANGKQSGKHGTNPTEALGKGERGHQ
jgi:hypothetical protein